uniref:Molybdopterin molybdenumtransferase n=1 Tax=Thermosporothrix sp. COM3 TaxID=2490863 RepID=A0A455SXZ6_9CHLR|nr:molybdopterin molybdenumtransferase MoeA [Thermosporothrix sp. COM3]
MLSVEEALKRILAAITPLESVRLPLQDAFDHILAQEIIAHDDNPPFANSAMDGFALQSQDTQNTPVRLKVIGDIAAGHVSGQTVTPGTAMRIMTGAPVPPGADAVIQIELTTPSDEWVEVLQPVLPGNNIRPAGEDIQKGQKLLSPGDLIGPWETGILATLGYDHVEVIRKPRVAILGTGDEVVEISAELQPGQIRNSNSYLLEAAVRKAGGIPTRLGIARDTVESLREKLNEAITYDLILTSGGVSVGDFDLVKDIMQEQGEMNFWRINMRPGKPVAFGHIHGVPLLGLPGNPVSSAVTFELFGRPVVRKLQGHTRLYRPQIEVIVADGVQEKAQRRHYVRAHVSLEQGRFVAHTTGKQGSNLLTSLLNANALVIVPEGGTQILPGQPARALMLDWPEVETLE